MLCPIIVSSVTEEPWEGWKSKSLVCLYLCCSYLQLLGLNYLCEMMLILKSGYFVFIVARHQKLSLFTFLLKVCIGVVCKGWQMCRGDVGYHNWAQQWCCENTERSVRGVTVQLSFTSLQSIDLGQVFCECWVEYMQLQMEETDSK